MSEQTETRRQVAERIVDEHLDEAMSPREYAATASALIDAIEAALKDRDDEIASALSCGTWIYHGENNHHA